MNTTEYRRHLLENAGQLASGRITAEQFNDINRTLEREYLIQQQKAEAVDRAIEAESASATRKR